MLYNSYMAHLYKKTFKGRTYWYVRETQRVGKKVQLKWQKYLGTCIATELYAYDKGVGSTYGQYLQNVAYLGGVACGAGNLIPHMQDDGAGGEEPYLDVDGNVYLVEDA